jgi:rubrerythrin
MIRLQASMVAGLREPSPDPAAVQAALQSAIKLEHATIPLYLYALYSLDPAKNAEIAAITASVVVEEMLHMTLAANVLNALGGTPVIDEPGFIPTYPGPLPGGVQSELTVSLAPFSTDQLDTFLTIEEPENAIDFPTLAAEADVITIGQFYAAISAAIAALGDGAFVDPPRNQVGPDLMDEAVVVVDVRTAQQALQTIVDQGEGTSVSPLEVVGSGYAHYYRYQQIAKGHLLEPTGGGPAPEDQYAYTGPAVPFDPSGVYAAPTDPGPYPPGSAQALANNNFNYTYTSLLGALHALFNGDATSTQMNTAIGLMMSLKEQAIAMMSGVPNPAVVTGPTFQYQPVNPAVGQAAS